MGFERKRIIRTFATRARIASGRRYRRHAAAASCHVANDGVEMSFKRRISKFTAAGVALACTAAPAAAQTVAAQSTATGLPPIVVEGATLQAKPIAQPVVKSKPKPQPVAALEPEPAPAPTPKPKTVKPKTAAKAAPQTTATEPPSAPQRRHRTRPRRLRSTRQTRRVAVGVRCG